MTGGPSRRAVLAAAATGGVTLFASPVVRSDDGAGRRRDLDGDPSTLAERGFPSSICSAPVKPDFHIREIVEPASDDSWAGVSASDRYEPRTADGSLADEAVVVGLAADGAARAYPLAILWHHEIVNDTLGRDGLPVLVTYCPLCQSAVVAVRRVRGDPTTFRVSGQLWKPPRLYGRASQQGGRATGARRGNASDDDLRVTANLVMYEEATGSYWSQLLARGICGPERGTRLEQYPSTIATWGEWRRDHPGTTVVLPPPHSETD